MLLSKVACIPSKSHDRSACLREISEQTRLRERAGQLTPHMIAPAVLLDQDPTASSRTVLRPLLRQFSRRLLFSIKAVSHLHSDKLLTIFVLSARFARMSSHGVVR